MSLPTSLLAYRDCLAALDQALANPSGIRIRMDSYDKAFYYRMRIHHARKLDRIKNKDVFEPMHPMHGCSEYDRLVCKLRCFDDIWYIYIVGCEVNTQGRIEILEPDAQLEYDPPPALPAPEAIETDFTDLDGLAVAEDDPPPAPLQITHIRRRV